MARSTSADVIVVGAGPAGATTALLLAREGRDVLLLDRAAFPRAKPCGDCLSIGATALLERLDLLDRVSAVPHARLRGWRVSAPDGGSFETGFNSDRDRVAEGGPIEYALSVERSLLDTVILDAALAAGARFEQCHVVDVLTDGSGRVTGVRTRVGVRTASITIGADGLRSVVATRLGARGPAGPLRKLSLTLHVPLKDPPAFGELHVGDGICAGLAPVDEQGRCNLTIVADVARYGRAVAGNARAFVRGAIASLPQLRHRIQPDALGDITMLASGPFDRPVRRCVFPGAALVGDAAGYYDPFTGQGVYQALAAAEILAPYVDHALNTGRSMALSGYERGRANLLRGPALVQRAIEMVVSRPALANRAVRRIRKAPLFAGAIIDVTGDVAPASALLSPRALSNLLAPAPRPEDAA